METHVGFFFKKISERLERRINAREQNKKDVTYAQGKILWFLHQNEDKDLSMRDIEKFFDCSHATVFGLVSRLAEKGYVCLQSAPSDKRLKIVKLTEKEQSLFKTMRLRQKDTEDTLLNGFSADEKIKFNEFLERVYRNLSNGEGEKCRSLTKQ